MSPKTVLAAILAAAAITGAPGAFAADEYNVSNGITLTGNPLGLHGIDAVSMFAGGAPAIGEGARNHLSSAWQPSTSRPLPAVPGQRWWWPTAWAARRPNASTAMAPSWRKWGAWRW